MTYTYNADGTLLRKMDAKGQKIEYTFAEMYSYTQEGLVTLRGFSVDRGGSGSTYMEGTFSYDNEGRPLTVVPPQKVCSWCVNLVLPLQL